MEQQDDAFAVWHKQPLGAEALALAIEQLQPIVDQLAGQSILQLGNSALLSHLSTKHIPHRISITQQISTQNSLVCSRYSELPLPNNSINVVLLPHLLEFISAPQTVLAESWRVLADDGHLIIAGFNPWSLWGLYKLFSKKNNIPWHGHFHDTQKWRKQIKQLEGSIVFFQYLFFRPPVNDQRFLQQTRWLDKMLQLLFPAAGGIYLLIAQKQVAPLIPIKPKFSWSKALLGERRGLEPTTRGVERG